MVIGLIKKLLNLPPEPPKGESERLDAADKLDAVLHARERDDLEPLPASQARRVGQAAGPRLEPGGAVLSNQASLTLSDGRTLDVPLQLRCTDVRDAPGGVTVELYDVTVPVPPHAQSVALTLRLPGMEVRDATIDGWTSFAGLEGRKAVGRVSAQTTSSPQRSFFLEPKGPAATDGPQLRSYGLMGLHTAKGPRSDVLVGALPTFEGLEELHGHWGPDGASVQLVRQLEGTGPEKPEAHLRLWVARGPFETSRGLFAEQLGQLKGDLVNLKGERMGCSWASFGKGVTQDQVEQEVAAGAGFYTGYITDDGWQMALGDWTANQAKFPDLRGLCQRAKAAGIRPGLWLAPFLASKFSRVYQEHPDWFMREKNGQLSSVVFGQSQTTHNAWPVFENPAGLDISLPEVREYLYGVFMDLAEQGVELFKVDFLAAAFMGPMANKDQTSVERYRSFFLELRRRLTEAGHQVAFIGCGAPLFESIGLFEGMRISPDTALPNLEAQPLIGQAVSFLSHLPWFGKRFREFLGSQTAAMYDLAMGVAAERLWQKAFGLFLDGVHLGEGEVPLDASKVEALNSRLPEVIGRFDLNVFVGDSFARLGEAGRAHWRSFFSLGA